MLPDDGDATADLASHDTFVHGVPQATFARLRREDPVSWTPDGEGGGFWSVTRHRDVVAVSQDPATFSSARGIRLEEMDDEELVARRTLMELDPPEHTRYRRLVSRPFTPRGVAVYEQVVRDLTVETLDGVAGQSTFDFTAEVARRIPMRMLGQVLGLPAEDCDWLVARGDALIANSDPDFTDFVVDRVDTSDYRLLPFRSPVAVELADYARAAFAGRRGAGGDDLLSTLLAPMVDGEHLDEAELANFFTLMVAAGNDTTRYSMVSAVKALIERPALWARLASAPEEIPTAVEELLRWASVTMHFRRTATKDVELAGTPVAAGDRVVIWFVSANYDEAAFDHPEVLDPTRHPNPHVTFGLRSPHLCIGAHLARLELRVLLEELLPRVAGAGLAGPEERLRSNFIAGIKRLPVEMAWR